MLKYISIFFIFINPIYLFSQVFTMSAANNNTSIANGCGGTFQDPGGTGNYAANQNLTLTFCAPAGQYIIFTFASFETEGSFDELNVYEGTSTAGTLLVTLDDDALPQPVVSTLGGCLTFNFSSDGSVELPGWLANITCSTTPPPPPPGAPACGTNPAAGNLCATSTPICDFNGYCGSTSATYTADNWTQLSDVFCGSIENDSYLSFTAAATTVNLNVWITSSTDNFGIQMMVFTTASCGSGAVTSFFCNGQIAPNTGAPQSTPLAITGLTVGTTYFIIIDGFAGDDCNYIIGVPAGSGSGLTPPVVLTPTTISVCTGVPVTLTASGGNGVYTWNVNPQLNTTSGATVIATPPSVVGTYTYTVNSLGGNPNCPSASVETATVTVTNCACTVTAANTNYSCLTNTVDLTATNVVGGTYSWTGPNGFTSTLQNPTNVLVPSISGTYNYVVTVTTISGTCTSTSTITVGASITVATTDITQCASSTIPATTWVSAPAGATYTWTNSNTTNGLAASGSGNLPSFVASATVGSSTITVTPSLGGCLGTVSTFTLDVINLPVINPITDLSLCAGENVPISNFTSTQVGTVFDWTNSTTAIGLTASGSGSYPSFIGANTTNADQIATISVTPSVGACIGAPETYSITIKTTPVFSPFTAQIYCSNQPILGSTFANNAPIGSTFAWTNNQTLIGLGASGNSEYAGFTGTNIGATNLVSTISVTPTLNGCAGTVAAYTITLKPLPTFSPTLLDIVICEGVNVTPANFGTNILPVSGNSFTWTNDNASIGLATNGTSNISPFIVQNTTNTPIIANITVIPTSNLCIGASDNFTITINPTPNVIALNNGPICTGQTLNLTASSLAGATFIWTGPNSFSSTQQNPAISSVTVAANGTYTVVASLVGCTSNNTTIFAATQVPSPLITLVDPVCVYENSFTMVASPAGGIWSGTGVTTVGIFDPGIANIGSNLITYTIPGLCTSFTTIPVVVNDQAVVTTAVDVNTGCLPLETNFSYTTNIPASTVLWNFGDGSSSTDLTDGYHIYTSDTCHNVHLKLTTVDGCITILDSADFVCVYPYAVADFVQPLPVTINEPVFNFINTSSNANNYLWEFDSISSSSIENPSFTFAEIPGAYDITLISSTLQGCNDTLTQTVLVEDVLIYYVPNTFTPNGDANNNTFQPIFTAGFDPFQFTMLIYDRWGEVIYETKNHTVGWDGSYNGIIVQDGIYLYTLRFKDKKTDKYFEVKGSTTLMR